MEWRRIYNLIVRQELMFLLIYIWVLFPFLASSFFCHVYPGYSFMYMVSVSVHIIRSKGKIIPKALFWDPECHQTSNRIVSTFQLFLKTTSYLLLLRGGRSSLFSFRGKIFLTASMKPHSKSMTSFLDRRQK